METKPEETKECPQCEGVGDGVIIGLSMNDPSPGIDTPIYGKCLRCDGAGRVPVDHVDGDYHDSTGYQERIEIGER